MSLSASFSFVLFARWEVCVKVLGSLLWPNLAIKLSIYHVSGSSAEAVLSLMDYSPENCVCECVSAKNKYMKGGVERICEHNHHVKYVHHNQKYFHIN